MKIRLTIAWSEGSDQVLMKMAAWSAIAHVVALFVFSVLPRFSQPDTGPRATIAEIVPASALFPSVPSAASGARGPDAGMTPSQRAEAAREATRPKAPPPAPKEEPARPPKKKAEPAAPPLSTGKPKPAAPPSEPPPAEPPPDAHEGADEDDSAAGASGAEQHGITFGGAAGPGGIPSIGSSAFPYDYYRSSLVAILQSNWRRPVAPEGLRQTVTCRIQFTILKSGIVQDPRIVQPSGNDALDQSALRAIYNSNPLPPLPFQYGRTSVSAEVVFELTPD